MDRCLALSFEHDHQSSGLLVSQLQLLVHLDPNIPSLLINDKTKIHRILLNLFSNAVKFTDAGVITFSAQLRAIENNQATIRFTIADTGVGIPKAQQHKVFDRFYRASPSYKGQYSGHGVGLHIAQSYAKLLGSGIQLISETGIGTTFYFDITSFIEREDCTASKILNQDSLCQSTEKKYIGLLVEDNPIALKILESLMTSAGLLFRSATDGESALCLAKSMSFDFILTDIGLPKMSGDEFVQAYRLWEKKQKHHPIPIFALTAHADNEHRQKCMQAEIDDIFEKPLSIEMIQRILAAIKSAYGDFT